MFPLFPFGRLLIVWLQAAWWGWGILPFRGKWKLRSRLPVSPGSLTVSHVDIFLICSWEEFYGFLLYHLNLTLGMVLHMLVSPFKPVVTSLLNFYLFLASPLGLCCCTWAISNCGEQGLLSSCGVWVSHCDGFSCCRCQLKKMYNLRAAS